MKAKQNQLLKFLESARQLTIPIYQRTYSWTKTECNQLWDDVMRVGARGGREDANHFLGSVVYILSSPEQDSASMVIDGQQRITTVSLIIEALARQIGDGEPIDGFSAHDLRNRYLRNRDKDGELSYKLILNETDKQTLFVIMDGRELSELPDEYSLHLKENFNFFREKMKNLNSDVASLCRGLNKLEIVEVALDRHHDNPQLIYESMNFTGRKLRQADLIRNFILMGLEPEKQTMLYNQHWRPMEVAFGQEAYEKEFDGFMYRYLTVKNGEIPKSGAYNEFKKLARSHIDKTGKLDSLVAEVHTYAGYYCTMEFGKETDPELASVFADFRELQLSTPYPLLLMLYHDYAEKRLSKEDLAKAVRLVESYIFRRAVCRVPTNKLMRIFAPFGKTLSKDRDPDSIHAYLVNREFPSDEDFRKHIKERDLYTFRYRAYWLFRLENHGRKERVFKGEYSIEHIMPQGELSRQWEEDLGNDWQRVHRELRHTLGNLTLTAYNSEYSNHSFAEKRDMRNGFRESPLFVNKGLGAVLRWDEAAIRARADRLAQKAIEVWTRERHR